MNITAFYGSYTYSLGYSQASDALYSVVVAHDFYRSVALRSFGGCFEDFKGPQDQSCADRYAYSEHASQGAS